MKIKLLMLALGASIALTAQAFAAPPAGAPAGTTGLCKDGSYWSGPTKQGACKGHKGVKDWYAAASTSGSAAQSTTAPKPATAAAPAAPAGPATTTSAAKPTTTSAGAKPAPGGGPGLVWVNTPSKVYHCPGTRYYGTTKTGSYMTEQAAIAAGNRADHGKACKS